MALLVWASRKLEWLADRLWEGPDVARDRARFRERIRDGGTVSAGVAQHDIMAVMMARYVGYASAEGPVDGEGRLGQEGSYIAIRVSRIEQGRRTMLDTVYLTKGAAHLLYVELYNLLGRQHPDAPEEK